MGDCTSGVRALSPVLTLRGPVVHGFGRGSKQLGIPTANLPADELDAALRDVPAGVYCGWASIGSSDRAYKMVMSIGWNPFFKNERKTVEPHLLHDFAADFYGEELRLVVTGYLRPEANFASLDALVTAIRADIAAAAEALDRPPHCVAATHAFLRPGSGAAPAPAAPAPAVPAQPAANPETRPPAV